MSMYLRILCLSLVLAGLAGATQDADAQFVKRLKERAKQHAGEKVIQKVIEKEDQAIDEAFEAGEEAISGQKDTPADGEAATPAAAEATAAASASLKPGEGAWANYDFVPGERPLFVDDFTADDVGDFPRRLEFKSGNMEIVEWQGQRWLRGAEGEFFVNLPETLPERFTLEFDLAGYGNAMQLSFAGDGAHQDQRIEIGTWYARLASGAINGEGELKANTEEAPVKIRLAVDGPYVKLYANEHRALNVPNANLSRSNRIYVFLNGWDAENPRMLANLRVMVGGAALYDALSAEGRVATQGLLFDTGSDVLHPASTPTLKEIGQMLSERPDLRLLIEGHTDDVGSAETNQTLSENRAAAVKAFLVATYAIDAARLETQGFGPSKPVADNTTPEGRQRNRRVELVKL